MDAPLVSTFVDRCGREGGGKGVLTQEDVASTLDCGATQRVYGIAPNIINRRPENGGHQLGVSDDGVAYTLDTLAPQAVVAVQENERNEVRITEEAGALSAGPPNKQGGWIMGGTCPNSAVGPLGGVAPTPMAYSDLPLIQATGRSQPATERGDSSTAGPSGESGQCGQMTVKGFRTKAGSKAGSVSYSEVSPTLESGQCGQMAPGITVIGGGHVPDGMTVRRLMPVECERLQGFPDGWTDIPGATDPKRYKALGNSMAVPVMRWIAEGIEMVDKMLQEDEPRFRKGARAQLGVALNALQEAEEALAFPDPDLSERIGHARNIAASAKEVLEERL